MEAEVSKIVFVIENEVIVVIETGNVIESVTANGIENEDVVEINEADLEVEIERSVQNQEVNSFKYYFFLTFQW